MPRSLLPAVVVLAFLAGCSSSSKPTTVDGAPPQPSPVGVPAGDPVTKSIGTGGGSVSSADGKITVTIPAGALAADTMIGIQPVTNTAAGGLGTAYRLTPAGQTFTTAVTLEFPYTDQDLNGTYAEALGVAYQDDAGRWEWQDGVALDAVAKTLTVQSTHFSDWSKVPGVQLRPPDAIVKLKGKVTLTVESCVAPGRNKKYVRFKCGDPADDLAALVSAVPGTWAVDGAPGGTTGHGLVSGNKLAGVYTAPATKPAGPSPTVVAVSVKVKNSKGTVQISAVVTILTGYHIVGKFTEKKSPLVCAGTVAALVSDAVSLDLVLTGENVYTAMNIKNFDTVYSGVSVPIVGFGVTVKTPPDVFKADKAEGNLLSDTQLVSVALNGSNTIGVCGIAGIPIPTTGQTSGDDTGFSFYTSNFFGTGVQKNLKSDIGRTGWLWTVTEQ